MSSFPSDIEYAQSGAGTTLLFVPGSFGTGAGWKRVIEQLGPGYRVVTTSLPGYGATADHRPDGVGDMARHVEMLDTVLARIDAPTHVVAHSFGTVAALAHAMQGRRRPVSLTLIEPNPFRILNLAGERDYADTFGVLMRGYLADYDRGEREAARRIIDFYGGPGTFDAFPPKVRDYVVATTPVNVRDWWCAAGFAPGWDDYRALDLPVLVLRGGDSPGAMLRIAELLTERLGSAQLATIEGGSHFLLASHPEQVAARIGAHVSAVVA